MAARKGAKGMATTTVEHKDGPGAEYVTESVESEVVEVPAVAAPTPVEKEKPLGRTWHDEGVTINMSGGGRANYQSYRIGCGVELPCPPAKIKEVSEWCERFVEKRLQAACDKLEGKAAGKLR